MRNTPLLRCRDACLWLVISLFSIGSPAVTESVEPTITLQEALSLTLARNPQLYQYRFITEKLKAQRKTNALRPELALEVEVENFAGSGDKKGFGAAETTLALSSFIELGDKRQARIYFSDAQIIKAEWEQKATTLELLGNLTEGFIDGLASQAHLQLAKDSLVLSQSILQTIETRSARGATSEAEIMRAKAACTRAEIRVAILKESLERQKVLLARFWGETTPRFNTFSGNLFEFGSTQDFKQLYARVLASPAVQVLTSEARILDAKITLARTKGRSDLNWRAGLKRFEESNDLAFTAGVSIPLFASERTSGEVKAALANRNAVDFKAQDLRLQLHAQLFEAWSLRKQNIVAANLIQTVEIPALKKALELTRKGFESGRYQYLELTSVHEELLSSKQALIESAATALISGALIEKLTAEPLESPQR